MNRTKVGARIRAIRGARGMTAQQLGRSVGLKIDVVTRTERGLLPICVERLELFANALGVTSADLLSEKMTFEL